MASAPSLLSFALECLASVVAPPRCAACDARVPLMSAFCGPCSLAVESAGALASGGDASAGCVAAFEYGGPVASSIARLKYERRPDLARPLGDLLWRALKAIEPVPRQTLVIPVPLHASRLAERGFNQSALIARRVARGFDVALLPLVLARVRDTPRQVSLGRHARADNLAGAFRVRQAERVRDRAILLVDDVRTTGATLDACARVLFEAGAASVSSAVVAAVREGSGPRRP